MLNQEDLQPDNVGPYALCQTIDELLILVCVLHGLDAVDQLLAEPGVTRESLREAANKFAAIGHKQLAAVVRKYARRAKPGPIKFGIGYQTNSALICVARWRAEAGQVH
jgi:hypothetical protein